MLLKQSFQEFILKAKASEENKDIKSRVKDNVVLLFIRECYCVTLKWN